MAKVPISLTDTKIKALKPRDKNYTLSDGQGLQLLVKPTGSKLWEFRYTSPTTLKRRKTSFGTYPTTSLKSAREKRNKLLKLIDDSIDPLEKKENDTMAIKEEVVKKENTFYKVSQEWWQNYEKEVSELYHVKLGKALENYIYPFIEKQPMDEIKRKDILEIIMDLKKRDLLETAKRVFILLNQIFRYAVVMEKTPHNIIADLDLKIIVGRIERKNYATFTDDEDIKGLLLSIDEYSGDYTTKMALKMLPYVFVRSFNIRHCEWSEINFTDKTWVIPAQKMKVKEEFILPLPPQVIDILTEMKKYSGSGEYVFPSFRAKDKPMSDNTLISAIRRMGYTKDEFVPHGFRAMFSTIAYEKANEEDGHNYTGEVIEALLAHKETNKVKGAYNRSKYIKPMKGLIEWYADYLDELKS